MKKFTYLLFIFVFRSSFAEKNTEKNHPLFEKNNSQVDNSLNPIIGNSHVGAPDSDEQLPWLYIIVCLFLILLIALILYLSYAVQRYSNAKYGPRIQNDAHVMSPLVSQPEQHSTPEPTYPHYMNVDHSNKNDYSLSLEIADKIGEGLSSCVFTGKLRRILNDVAKSEKCLSVAVKKPISSRSSEQRKMLLDEVKVMRQIGKHPNIVYLIGEVRNKTEPGPVVALELCSNGNLHNYLKKHRQSFLDEIFVSETGSSDAAGRVENYKASTDKNWERRRLSRNGHLGRLCTADLISFAYQIACGMEHLSKSRCVHRDIAARNILISNKKTCKIADFGLARVVEDIYYRVVRNQNVELPTSWMSIEALKEKKSSQASDVWSYGILLFEIFSLGEPPYSHFLKKHRQEEIMDFVFQGGRNKKPRFCPEIIYNFMLKCWDETASKRPTFSECANFMKNQLLQASPGYIDRLEKIRREEMDKYRELNLWLNGDIDAYETTIVDSYVDSELTTSVGSNDDSEERTKYTVVVENENGNIESVENNEYLNLQK